jgi:hypothetical protein
LAGLGALAAGVIWFASPWGIGVEYDSVFYWSAAENLLAGRGLGRLDGAGEFVPLTHFPPLYPLLLAAVAGLADVSVIQAARLTSAGLFGLNVFLFGRLSLRLLPWALPSFAAALLAAISPALLDRHLWAMSEPLYFALLLAFLFCLTCALREPGAPWLAAAAAAASLAAFTRYAGLSLIGTGALALALLGAERSRDRLVRAGLFTAMAALLPVCWEVRTLVIAGTPTNRALIWHPPGLGKLREAGLTIAGWVPYQAVPAETRFAVVAALGLLVAVMLLRERRGHDRAGGRSEPALLGIIAGLHGLVYLGFLGLSLTFLDASTRLRDRLLSPLFLVGLLMVVGLLALRVPRWWRSTSGRFSHGPLSWVIAVGVFLLWAVPYAVISWGGLEESKRSGLGFSGRDWRQSETIARVRELGADLRLFSNEAFPIYFLTGRPVSWVPERLDPVKGLERSRYRQELESMQALVRASEAALILFRPNSLRPELPPLGEIVDGLTPALEGADGVIYLGAIDRDG